MSLDAADTSVRATEPLHDCRGSEGVVAGIALWPASWRGGVHGA